MARKAADGTEFTNGMALNRHNRRLAAQGYGQSAAPAPDASSPDDPGSPQPIEDNPQAMKCVDELKSMGYTADDVAQAMGDQDQQQDNGQAAASAAPLQLPGMQ